MLDIIKVVYSFPEKIKFCDELAALISKHNVLESINICLLNSIELQKMIKKIKISFKK